MTTPEGGTERTLQWTLSIVVLARFATMGIYPLSDTTEARYAEVARKMLELGDWITQWYEYGTPFWAKPPLSTWLTAGSFKLFGINEFAARLPHFLLALLIGWLVWGWIARRSRREALLAVALLCGTLVFSVSAAAVMTDITLALGTTLAMRGFWVGFHGSDSRRSREQWWLFAGLGIGLLAKGPIALILSGLPIFLWALFTGNLLSAWKRLSWIRGGLLTLAIAAPWYWLAETRTPGFLDYFFIGEHWNRFTVAGWAGDRYGSAHVAPRGSIWLLAVAACLPWPVLLPLLTLGRKKAVLTLASETSGAQWRWYLLAWGLAPCLFFTASGNILWTYVLPATPALAILAAGWLAGDVRTRRVDRVVSAGLVVTLSVLGFIAWDRAVSDSWKTAKAVVAEYQIRNTENRPLLFVGDRPYSAAFYSRGKALLAVDASELAAQLGRGHSFVALTPQQILELPIPLKASLHLEKLAGHFDLYSSVKN